MGPFTPTSVTGPFAPTTTTTMASDHSAPTTTRPALAALGTAPASLFPPASAFSTLGYPLSTPFPIWPAAPAPVPPLPVPPAGMVDPSSFLLGVQSAQAAFAQLLAAVGGGAGFPLDLAGTAGVAPTDLVNRFPMMMVPTPATAAANPGSSAMDGFAEPLFPTLPTFPTAPATAPPPPPPATAPAPVPPAPALAPATRFPNAFLHTTDPPLASASFCDPHAGGRIQSPADLHAWLALDGPSAPAASEPRRDWIPPPADPAAMLDIEDFLMLDDDHVAAPAVAIGFDDEDVKMDVPVPVEVAMEELVLDAAAPRNADPFLFGWPAAPAPAPPPPPTAAAAATDENPVCAHCGITKTPLWRRGDNDEMLCNACGL
ncbi:hypothetical protein AMAG_07863 [Allomyces macrogynus ATCC 38327]|uniref:GATA-type domain-containing protein n=1 Tax=Allomyces macrogynus (strain ATCC 38327) TaxID=578462 RepID=A0A0L0SJT6_ALLM3|nr:hypothetical protein AMAG_07863 [Allomyces macrogynus ATCC 38327]|eukprot:KNE62670.1 hypothetical protein AMAG_07863 [Allomyces macrogynus ATCC 38327]